MKISAQTVIYINLFSDWSMSPGIDASSLRSRDIKDSSKSSFLKIMSYRIQKKNHINYCWRGWK